MSEYGKLPYRELTYRELEDYSNMQAAQIRKKNNKIEQLQARVQELDAINIGLTKTLLEEKAELVGALERLVGDVERATHVEFGGTPWLKEKMAEIDYARIALAAYRKQGGEV